VLFENQNLQIAISKGHLSLLFVTLLPHFLPDTSKILL